MKRILFSTLILFFSLCAFAAFANEAVAPLAAVADGQIAAAESVETDAGEIFIGGLGFFEPEPGNAEQETMALDTKYLVVSNDKLNKPEDRIPLDAAGMQKSVTAPDIPALLTGPLASERKTLNSTYAATAASGPGNSPSTAPHFPVNSGYYPGRLSAAGQQHWFYTVADRDGQMTVHLDVPNDANVDYDLYVHRFDPATGNVYTFKYSTSYPTYSEHITFMTTRNSIYFIVVDAYQGASTDPYYLHIEMATPDAGEIDDFPSDSARTLPIGGVTLTGELTMRNDEDFIKFTPTGNVNYGLLRFDVTNVYVVAALYQLEGTTLYHMGYLEGKGQYPIPLQSGKTYFLKIFHFDNKNAFAYTTQSYYDVSLDTFYSAGGQVKAVLGFSNNKSKVAYVNTSDKVYVNGSYISPYGAWSYYHEFADGYIRINVDASGSGSDWGVRFGYYHSTMPGKIVEDAVMFIPKEITYSNYKYYLTYVNGREEWLSDSDYGYKYPNIDSGGFILHANRSGEVVDFASRQFNGFYNPAFYPGNENFNFSDR